MIQVADPLMAYLTVVRQFISFHPQTMPIHPSAKIGEGTVVQPCTFIGENVVIGKNCIIHSNVSIYADTIIGDNVTIHSGSVIGADACYFQRRPDGWVKFDSCGKTVIGNDVEDNRCCRSRTDSSSYRRSPPGCGSHSGCRCPKWIRVSGTCRRPCWSRIPNRCCYG